MKKLTLISIGLSLLLIFAGCSDSNKILSPADDLSRDATGAAGTLSKPGAQQTIRVELRPIGGQINWWLQAKLTSNGNGQYRGSGKFGIKIPLGGAIFIPIGGIMEVEQNSSGEVSIELRAQGQEQGVGRVRLRFSGSGTGSVSVTGRVRGTFSLPDLRGRLNGAAQIQMDEDPG